MDKSKVLGSVFYEGFRKYLGESPTPDQVKLWHAGFVTAQAEKISIGACHGAMFRVGPSWRWLCLPIDHDIAERYGLQIVEISEEIWMVDPTGQALLEEMLLTYTLNSPEWHIIRGRICGIPTLQIDTYYHLREGYRGRTD